MFFSSLSNFYLKYALECTIYLLFLLLLHSFFIHSLTIILSSYLLIYSLCIQFEYFRNPSPVYCPVLSRLTHTCLVHIFECLSLELITSLSLWLSLFRRLPLTHSGAGLVPVFHFFFFIFQLKVWNAFVIWGAI